MKEKKDITITNSAFTMTIHWNGQVVSAQLCILIGLVLLKVFSRNSDVQVLCNVIMLIDIVSIVVSLLWGGSIDTGGKKEEQTATETKSETVSPPAEKEIKKQSNHSSSAESSKTVTKRVPMPIQKGVKKEMMKEQTVEQEQQPVQQEQQQPAEESPKQIMGEMSNEDLNDLFNW